MVVSKVVQCKREDLMDRFGLTDRKVAALMETKQREAGAGCQHPVIPVALQ